MKRVYFIFGVHCHQPVGNFDQVIEQAYNAAYRPFVETLAAHPQVKMAFHITGYLVEWLVEHHPEFIELVRELVRRGQLEMMTGGYYEPILAVIPEEDRRGQIRALSALIRELFVTEASGLWLAERVWEPHLAKSIAEAGVKYIAVDDYHFLSSRQRSELFGYFATEDQGATISVLPISERLRYYIPFRLVGECIDYLDRTAREQSDRLLVMIDDAEKFGVWPGTHDWVYGQGWLDKFFSALEDNSDWLKLVTPSEYMREHPPLGTLYLPTASYFEMNQWTLPPELGVEFDEFLEQLKASGSAERFKPFLKGGTWRNFLARYPESNNLHKKMLLVSRRVRSAFKAEASANGGLSPALRELFKGQCNDAYWHGIFGGLYMPHLRRAAYQHLIRAERLADQKRKRARRWVEAELTDFNSDGRDELLVSTPELNVYFHLAEGGSIFELDYKRKDFNLVDTLARRPESYHLKALAEKQVAANPDGHASIHELDKKVDPELRPLLSYDWYRRAVLIDHFLGEETELESFIRSRYPELGDFVNQPYSHTLTRERGGLAVALTRRGGIYRAGRKTAAVEVTKRVRIPSDAPRLEIDYSVLNLEERQLDLWFGVEFNFSLQAGPDRSKRLVIDGQREQGLLESGEVDRVGRINIFNGADGFVVTMVTLPESALWCFPLQTVSQSESGFEKITQGNVLMLHWRFCARPGQAWRGRISLELEELERMAG